MFHQIAAGHFKDKLKDIQQVDPKTTTWIASDLPTKNKIQNILLKNQTCLPEDAVLRINELWRKILARLHPDCELASNQFAQMYLAEWLKKRDISWARHPNSATTLIEYISVLMPVIVQPQARELMREWLKQNTDVFLRWGGWFELACEAWDYFSVKKILAPTWVSGFLSQSENFETIWPRQLRVDVGPDMTPLENELFKSLAKNSDVFVYCGDQVLANDQVGRYQCRRFATVLAEVKEAVAYTRRWLDEGIDARDICIVAAKIEEYWPVLSEHLDFEGIVVNKDKVLHAQSLIGFGRWLARLRIEAREIDPTFLEADHYQQQNSPGLAYDKFRQLFSKIYDENDLSRDQKIKSLYEFKFTANQHLNRDQFFSWAVRFWAEDISKLEGIVAKILQECPGHFELELRSWLSYLTALVAKNEIRLTVGNPAGVQCLNIDATLGLTSKKVILLGLHDEALTENTSVAVTQYDAEKINRDLGFGLANIENNKNQYYAERILRGGNEDVVLMFSASDFNGDILAPSLFWLKAALDAGVDVEEIFLPQPTRWDEYLESMSHEQSFVKDNINIRQLPELKFSPTQLKKYVDCPFVFLSEKLFHLSDLPDIDLDVDAMTSGRILHAALQEILNPEGPKLYSRQAISETLDNIRTKLALPVADERLWPAKKENYIKTLEKFIVFESEWRNRFPKTVTVGKEVRISGELALSDDLRIAVTGQIDRIDSAPSIGNLGVINYVVMDYKTSAGGLTNHSGWIKNDDWQLLFYATCIEEGLTDLPAGDVIAAFYFVLSNMSREKGYRILSDTNNLYETTTRNKSPLTVEALQILKQTFKTRMLEIVKNIQSGEFKAKPTDYKLCYECKWNTLCRAPHLN